MHREIMPIDLEEMLESVEGVRQGGEVGTSRWSDCGA